VTFTVTGTNDTPEVEAALSATATEDGPEVSVDLLTGASDVDAGETARLAVQGLGELPAGVSLSEDGRTLTLDPSHPAYQDLGAGETREVVVSYEIVDPEGATVAQTATFTVTGANDAPEVEAALSATATEDGSAVSVDLLTGASDVDAGETDQLAVQALGELPAGVSLGEDGRTLTLDPSDPAYQDLSAGETREVVVSYEIVDPEGATVAQTVTFTVTGTNDAPEVTAIDAGSVSEDAAPVTIDLLAGGQSDVDSASLSVRGVSVTDDLGATVSFTDSGDGNISIDPDQYDALGDGESRTLTVHYEVFDGSAATANTATLVVEGVTDSLPPEAGDDVLRAGVAAEKLSGARIAVFDNGAFVDTAGSTSSESDNVQATLTSLGHSVTPFTGTGSSAFEAALAEADVLLIPEMENGDFMPDAATLQVIRDFVEGGGTLVVNGDSSGGDEALLNALFGWSLDQGSRTTSGTSTATGAGSGTTFGDDPGSLTNNNAVDPIRTSSLPEGALSLYETGGDTAVAAMQVGSGQVVTVAFDWFNAQPRGTQDGGWVQVLDSAISRPGPAIDEDSVLEIPAARLLGNDSDPEGETLSIQSVSGVSTRGAAVRLNPDGSVTYDPTGSETLGALSDGETLEDSFTYVVSDGRGGTDTATVTLTVEGVTDLADPGKGDTGEAALLVLPAFDAAPEPSGALTAQAGSSDAPLRDVLPERLLPEHGAGDALRLSVTLAEQGGWHGLRLGGIDPHGQDPLGGLGLSMPEGAGTRTGADLGELVAGFGGNDTLGLAGAELLRGAGENLFAPGARAHGGDADAVLSDLVPLIRLAGDAVVELDGQGGQLDLTLEDVLSIATEADHALETLLEAWLQSGPTTGDEVVLTVPEVARLQASSPTGTDTEGQTLSVQQFGNDVGEVLATLGVDADLQVRDALPVA
jgi:VCBS repeat-containing protein